jgi:DNA-binding MarR family transcriptional regulator
MRASEELTGQMRHVQHRLTPNGHDLLTGSHRWQRRVFDELTVTWDQQDRRQFAAYLQRLADELGA